MVRSHGICHMTDSARARILNCFSVDVEGFVESNLQSFAIDPGYVNRARGNYEIEKNMAYVLELLDGLGTKATFFFLGRLARDTPGVLKEAARLNHEIACHSYLHLRVFGITPQEFRQKLETAKKRLEDVSGNGVFGFRAPDFSITRASLWALDILRELGFAYDSSIYPIGMHDVYGIRDTDPFIHKHPNGLIEFPLSTLSVFGRRFPFGGGGYFRLYPLFLTKRCVAAVNRVGQPCMFYIHPYEAGPIIPKLPHISPYRRFRHYYNCHNGARRLKELLRTFRFASAIDVLSQRGLLGNGTHV
jgi:polysaccharide deacetylase family protein (PEP-CTERM system associated)